MTSIGKVAFFVRKTDQSISGDLSIFRSQKFDFPFSLPQEKKVQSGVFDGRIYFVTEDGKAYCYSYVLNEWIFIPALINRNRNNSKIIVYQNFIYVVGSSCSTAFCERYDVPKNIWVSDDEKKWENFDRPINVNQQFPNPLFLCGVDDKEFLLISSEDVVYDYLLELPHGFWHVHDMELPLGCDTWSVGEHLVANDVILTLNSGKFYVIDQLSNFRGEVEGLEQFEKSLSTSSAVFLKFHYALRMCYVTWVKYCADLSENVIPVEVLAFKLVKKEVGHGSNSPRNIAAVEFRQSCQIEGVELVGFEILDVLRKDPVDGMVNEWQYMLQQDWEEQGEEEQDDVLQQDWEEQGEEEQDEEGD